MLSEKRSSRHTFVGLWTTATRLLFVGLWTTVVALVCRFVDDSHSQTEVEI